MQNKKEKNPAVIACASHARRKKLRLCFARLLFLFFSFILRPPVFIDLTIFVKKKKKRPAKNDRA
jgi:hypothetical protein